MRSWHSGIKKPAEAGKSVAVEDDGRRFLRTQKSPLNGEPSLISGRTYLSGAAACAVNNRGTHRIILKLSPNCSVGSRDHTPIPTKINIGFLVAMYLARYGYFTLERKMRCRSPPRPTSRFRLPLPCCGAAPDTLATSVRVFAFRRARRCLWLAPVAPMRPASAPSAKHPLQIRISSTIIAPRGIQVPSALTRHCRGSLRRKRLGPLNLVVMPLHRLRREQGRSP